MPWEVTADYIRSGHKGLEGYDKSSLRTIAIDDKKGIKAIVACPKGSYDASKCEEGMEVISFLFAKADGWTMDSAKAWFAKNEPQHGRGRGKKRSG
ncbi:MAG TPA: hypothetical protein VEH08_03900 [Methanomassiliicoccales archaeon]|nr:hypothetical protein [Methanomassiliicoccales archaeon]